MSPELKDILSQAQKLDVSEIGQELQILFDRFEAWQSTLVNNPNILGGETVFPNSRLSVQGIGSSLERGETLTVLREDYSYLTDEDFHFARIYVKAYRSISILKNWQVQQKFMLGLS
jgi:uncharacterized protein (DUF433 family)